MNTEHNSIDNLVNDTLAQEQKNLTALAMLLDQYASKQNHNFVQRMEMGGTESFIGSVTLEWLADKVSFASELPLFTEKLDETGSIVIDESTINELVQRPLNYERESELAQYLAVQDKHKFPPVLVVVSQPWVDNPEADEWDSNGRAVTSAARFSALDSEGNYGLINLTGMQIYALDGQHRLLGVAGLLKLIRTGSLPILNKNRKQKAGATLEVDKMIETFGISRSHLQSLATEKIGVEFISAVVAGETREEAKRRVRSIFVHVNRMAAKLTTGQLNTLDEDNGFALVAKKVAVSHDLLSVNKRVNWNKNQISKRSMTLTTLETLTGMASKFLGSSSKFKNWAASLGSGVVPLRPEAHEIAEGITSFTELLDGFADLPSIVRMVQGTSPVLLRSFTSEIVEKENGTKGEGNLLFRPVGQLVIAQALGELVRDGMDLNKLLAKLRSYDSNGGFSGMDKADSVWYGILYDPNGARMLSKGQALAVKVLKYLLGEVLNDEEREGLRVELAASRTIEDETTDFDGNRVKQDTVKLKLPNPIVP